MTFTYTEDLTVGRDFVRFHTGDVVSAQAFLSDEIITSLIATTGSKERAVIASFRHIITRLSQPNFRADWLQVDNDKAREGYEHLLTAKMRELGVNEITASVTHVYRADSGTTEEPDFTDGRPGGAGEDFDPYALVGN